MSDTEEKIIKIYVVSGDAAFLIGLFVTAWISLGDPDLIDAIIHNLMK